MTKPQQLKHKVSPNTDPMSLIAEAKEMVAKEKVEYENRTRKYKRYVENWQIRQELISYWESGTCVTDRIITENMGEYIMKLVYGFSKMGNYVGYPYIDEMQCAARHQIITKIHKIPVNHPHPYGYMNKIIDNRFKAYIKSEHKEDKIKNRSLDVMMEETDIELDIVRTGHDEIDLNRDTIATAEMHDQEIRAQFKGNKRRLAKKKKEERENKLKHSKI